MVSSFEQTFLLYQYFVWGQLCLSYMIRKLTQNKPTVFVQCEALLVGGKLLLRTAKLFLSDKIILLTY